jgi:uncharacterized membrane protein YphA (DoxX/SURF4 family)
MMNATSSPRPIAAVLDAPGVALIGRILLTSPFWISGVLKLFDFPSAVGEAAHFGLQPAALVAVVIILLQIGGSLAVVLGRWTWLGAGALGVFTALANLVGGLILAAILAESRRR